MADRLDQSYPYLESHSTAEVVRLGRQRVCEERGKSRYRVNHSRVQLTAANSLIAVRARQGGLLLGFSRHVRQLFNPVTGLLAPGDPLSEPLSKLFVLLDLWVHAPLLYDPMFNSHG